MMWADTACVLIKPASMEKISKPQLSCGVDKEGELFGPLVVQVVAVVVGELVTRHTKAREEGASFR